MADKTNKPHRNTDPAEARPERVDTTTVLADLNCDEDAKTQQQRNDKPGATDTTKAG